MSERAYKGRKAPFRALIQLLTAILLALLVAEAATAAETSQPVPGKTGRVEANGVSYYYEIHGQGEPLLLLHGGLGSIDMFRPNVLPALAATRQVIAVDLHGHGRTPLGDRKINLIDIGDDLAVILKELGYAQVDVLGYSFGAGAGFRLAVQHPDSVRRLALVSGGFAQDGFYPEMLPMQAQVGAGMAEQMKGTPMYQSYVAVAPDPAEFPKLLDAMGELMRTPYNWAEDVKKLKMPVMLVYRRQRHVPARAHRRVLSAARRRAEGRRMAARAHVAESPRDPARPHALRHFPGAGVDRGGPAVPRRKERRTQLGRTSQQ